MAKKGESKKEEKIKKTETTKAIEQINNEKTSEVKVKTAKIVKIVKTGDIIKVEYKGLLDDGAVFDQSTPERGPLEFEAGAGQVIKGFDDAVKGMKLNETKKFKVPSHEAYGEHNDMLVQLVPKAHMPPGQEPAIGMMLMLNLPTGEKFPATITEVTQEYVKIDLNHPLAGKDLNFEIKIVEIN